MTDSEVIKNPLAVYEVSSRGCRFGVWCVVSVRSSGASIF